MPKTTKLGRGTDHGRGVPKPEPSLLLDVSHYQSLYPNNPGHLLIYGLQQQWQVLLLSSKTCFLLHFSLLAADLILEKRRIPVASCILPWLFSFKRRNFIWLQYLENTYTEKIMHCLSEIQMFSFGQPYLEKTKTILILYPPTATNHLARRCLLCLSVPCLLPRKTVTKTTSPVALHSPVWTCQDLASMLDRRLAWRITPTSASELKACRLF